MTQLRLLALAFALTWSAVLAGAPAAAAGPQHRCTAAAAAAGVAPAAPGVRLSVNHAPVRYEFSRSGSELATIIARHGSAAASTRMMGRRVHGLTHSSLGYNLGAAFDLLSLADGTWCLWPRRVDAELGYSETTVYIANAYRRDSCAFQAVLAHEEEHVAINAAVVEDHTARLEAALSTLALEGFPLAGPDPQVLQEVARDHLDSGFRAALEPMLIERARRNAAIDTEPAYRSLAAQCDRW